MSFSAPVRKPATPSTGARDPDLAPLEDVIEGEDSSPESPDWGKIGALAAGIVIGAVIGAGSALLLAPQSGADTRMAVRGAARKGRQSASDAWDHLNDELWWMARKGRRRLGRGRTKAGWAVEDMLDHLIGPALGRGRPRKRKDEDEDDDDYESRRRVVIEEE
jgi:hypothetical protein